MTSARCEWPTPQESAAPAPSKPTAPGPTSQTWRKCERRKQAWIESHPDADADDIEDALRRIAHELQL